MKEMQTVRHLLLQALSFNLKLNYRLVMNGAEKLNLGAFLFKRKCEMLFPEVNKRR